MIARLTDSICGVPFIWISRRRSLGRHPVDFPCWKGKEEATRIAKISENGLAKRNFFFRILVPMFSEYQISDPSADTYSASGVLKTPNGQLLNRETCAPWQVVESAVRQDSKLAERRIYKGKRRGYDVNSEIELIGAVAEHYGDRLFTMTPAQIRHAYEMVLNAMEVKALQFIARNDIQHMVARILNRDHLGVAMEFSSTGTMNAAA